MSADADPPRPVELPAGWARLERAAADAIAALEAWRARALQAEAEIEQLRRALEEAAAAIEPAADARGELRRLRAENAALRSRISQAHRRVSTLLAWTDALEDADEHTQGPAPA